MRNKGFVPIIILLILVVVALIGIFYVAFKKGLVDNPFLANETSTPKPSTSAMPPSVTPVVLPNGVKNYISQNLGISFIYKFTYDSGEKIDVKEIGNKIYVYSVGTPVDQGQYIEVFQKDPADSLMDAINKTIMIGYSSTDCLVKVQVQIGTGNGVELPASYTFAEIRVPVSEGENLDTLGPKYDKCPKPYTASNGIAYFLMDKDHPSQFAFVSIGQYALMADGNKTWQDTIKFTK